MNKMSITNTRIVKQMRLFAIVIAAIILSLPATTLAQDTTLKKSVRISVETDPLDFLVYNGWGAFINLRPANSKHWGFRIGGGVAYPPKALTEGNGNIGWSFGYDPVGTIAVQRFFSSSRGGLFATVVLGAASIKYTAPTSKSLRVFQLQVQAGGGYRWFPFKKLGLVLTPYLTMVAPIYRSESATIDGMTYKAPSILPIPEILIGWEFKL
jgi:hypothetical protein